MGEARAQGQPRAVLRFLGVARKRARPFDTFRGRTAPLHEPYSVFQTRKNIHERTYTLAHTNNARDGRRDQPLRWRRGSGPEN